MAQDHGQDPAAREDLARTLSDMARSLQAEPDYQHTIDGIVQAATDGVPGAEGAGVSLRDGATLRTVAATSTLVHRITDMEHDLGEGPCVQAAHEHGTYRIDDMAQDTRWPRFAAAALRVGIQSMLGYRLFVDSRTLGALDLYSTQPNAFDRDAELIGELFAAHAAVAMIASAEKAEWQTALNSRDTIGMAKGILMHRERLTDERAFALLVATSQRSNIKIQDIAKWLVEETNGVGRSAANTPATKESRRAEQR